jgi:hypothetical protein
MNSPFDVFQARISVLISFLLIAPVGAVLVLAFRWPEGSGLAIWLTSLFVVTMACIHGAGYLLYVQQFVPRPADETERLDGELISPRYWPALKFGSGLQVALGCLTALMLDSGRSFGYFQVAFLGYWPIVLLMIWRRRTSPTRGDIVFIRWGIVFTLCITSVMAPYVWNFIGESYLPGWQRLQGYEFF